MNIPDQIVQGDSISWKDSGSQDNLGNSITPGDWALSYSLRGPSSIDLTASVSGSEWLTTVSKTQSASLEAGTYYWQAYASKGSDRVTIGAGKIKIVPNVFDQSEPYDGRSQAQKDLDAVQSAMRAMISGGGVIEYTIGNRQVKKMSLTDLMTLESQLKAAVAREKAAESMANGLGNPRKLLVRF